MIDRNTYMILNISIALLILLHARAEDSGIDMQDKISNAFLGAKKIYIPMEDMPAVYQEISKDEKYSAEFREFAAKRYRLTVIRQGILDLLQDIHDQKSAELAAEQICAYDKEVAELDIRQAFINIRRKANGAEKYLLQSMFRIEDIDCGHFHKKMQRCIKDKNLYQYEALKRELNPRLHCLWNHPYYMPSFCVSTEPIITAYKEICGDSTYSAELRKFVMKCLRLDTIRNQMLEAASMIHDEASAIEAGKILERYEDEIDDLGILRYYIEIKDKLSGEEQMLLDRLLRWRYDEVTAYMSRYMQIWEEKGLEQYEEKVENLKYSVYRTDYMYERKKSTLRMGTSVQMLRDEVSWFPEEGTAIGGM